MLAYLSSDSSKGNRRLVGFTLFSFILFYFMFYIILIILLYFIFLIYVFHLFLVPSFLHVAPIAVPIITENSSVTSSAASNLSAP